MIPFAHRFIALARERSPLCLGIDPSAELLDHWGLSDDAEGVRRFCGIVLDAAVELVPMMKPQMAFFERHGSAGYAEAAAAVAQIRAQGALCLVDAKRGDIASTMEGYAAAIFESTDGLGADAVTLNPYLGFETLEPVISRAQVTGGGVFVVVRSTNPGARLLQTARLSDGRSVAEALADEITAHNASIGGDIGPVGSVIGSTLTEEDTTIVKRLPRSLILAPGLGAQGAEMSDVVRKFGAVRGRIVPTISRGILRHGPDRTHLRDAIKRYRDAAWSIWDTAQAGASA
ncbi:orotidine-5'-phosphate decarboxylase [uncultured Paracoccus sp.]|jgi:orotidine-5'-phosphate decarboxylase|uniref:orotidine-5'-phosphate decarboxylase n=1 Tax=uncultured Paracoccus sp. TaxID=189685 RepID=UPI00260BA0DD|nr:orotidine-5'-phosphate decarboxylase [uncultured Paracoccus sp.]